MHVFLEALSFINVFMLRKPFAIHYDLPAKYIYLHILEELVSYIITVCLIVTVCLVNDLGQGGEGAEVKKLGRGGREFLTRLC